MTRVALLALALFCVPGPVDGAQAICDDCQPLVTQVKQRQQRLRQAEAQLQELQSRLDELKRSNTRAAADAVPRYTAMVEAARKTVRELAFELAYAESELRLCQRRCESRGKRQQSGDPVDESIPRAACRDCQPLVDHIKDLQRRRRYARNRAKDIQELLDDLATRIVDERTFTQAMALTVDQATAERTIADYTAQIAQALIDLTACNLKCGAGGSPGDTNTTGGTPSPAGPPVATRCPSCADAVRSLQEAETRRKAVADELEEYERDQRRQESQHRTNQTTLRELRGSGRGESAEAQRLDDEIRAFEQHQSFRQSLFEGDPYLRALQQRLSNADREVSGWKQKLEECEKECKPTETSGIFKGPIPYVAGGAVLGGLLLTGGGDPLPTLTSQTPSPPGTANPTGTPPITPVPPAQADCSQSSGTIVATSTLRTPASCLIAGRAVFPSPMNIPLILQLNSACTGTVTVRYSNDWVFAYAVRGTFNGSTLRIVSVAPFTSTQVFGVPTSSTTDLTLTANALSGTETHVASGCTDVYDLRGARQ